MTPAEVAHMSVTTPLADGTLLHLRPIVPSDATLLGEGFRRLSPESRFLRFFSPMEHLSSTQLRYFTEIDYVDHFAWVATVAAHHDPTVTADAAGEIGVGVARYIRLTDTPGAAEAAVAVADDQHGKGIGTILLESLAAVALNRGIDAFHLLVRADNNAMIAVMTGLGAARSSSDDPSTICFVLDLPAMQDDLRSTVLWKVFRTVGSGSAELSSTLRRRAEG